MIHGRVHYAVFLYLSIPSSRHLIALRAIAPWHPIYVCMLTFRHQGRMIHCRFALCLVSVISSNILTRFCTSWICFWGCTVKKWSYEAVKHLSFWLLVNIPREKNFRKHMFLLPFPILITMRRKYKWQIMWKVIYNTLESCNIIYGWQFILVD